VSVILSNPQRESEKKRPYTLTERLQNRIDDVVSFSGTYQSYCVGVVDVVNSTKITANLQKDKVCKYYSIFLNCMALIAKDHGAAVVKSIGDSLLYYFPETSKYKRDSFLSSLNCGMAMISCSDLINSKMSDAGLPPISFRISSDFGTVMLAKSVISSCDDIFGSTVNICTKINRRAKPYEMVIGNDLYQIVKQFEDYKFDSVIGYSVGLKCEYPVYSIRCK